MGIAKTFVYSFGFLAIVGLAAHKQANSIEKVGLMDRQVMDFVARPQAQRGEIIPDHYIVQLNDEVSFDELFFIDTSVQGAVYYQNVMKGFAAKLTAEQIQSLRNDSRVQSIVPDEIMTLDSMNSENDAVWGLSRVDQRAAPADNTYEYNYTGRGVNVYVLDSGVRVDHSEFSGGRARIVFDSYNDNGGDCHGHGTHTAGTIGGQTFGVAKGANINAVRVFSCDGRTSLSSVIAGAEWIVANAQRPAVVNMSIGGRPNQQLDQAVKTMIGKGITVVVSAGNNSRDACEQSPAKIPEVITVGATDKADNRADFSNWGSCIDIFAPGVDIISAGKDSSEATQQKSGTSMAAPHVTGVVALYLEHHPEASPAEVASAIKQFSTKAIVNKAETEQNNLIYSLEDQ